MDLPYHSVLSLRSLAAAPRVDRELWAVTRHGMGRGASAFGRLALAGIMSNLRHYGSRPYPGGGQSETGVDGGVDLGRPRHVATSERAPSIIHPAVGFPFQGCREMWMEMVQVPWTTPGTQRAGKLAEDKTDRAWTVRQIGIGHEIHAREGPLKRAEE